MAITPLSDPPSRAEPSTFSVKTDTFLSEIGTFATEANALAVDVNNAASAIAAGVVEWVSGTTYAVGRMVWSPVDFWTYRRIVAGAGTTDPSADATNWLYTGKVELDSSPKLGGDLDLNGHVILGLPFVSGTAMLFSQTTAPTGWTKSITHNDKAIRVVSGIAGTGGSVAFETAFANKSVSGSVTVAGHALTVAEIPSHTHDFNLFAGSGYLVSPGSVSYAKLYDATDDNTSGMTGGSGSHGHTGSTFSGTAINLDVSYVDVIIATKD
jgi:hypothetical protein